MFKQLIKLSSMILSDEIISIANDIISEEEQAEAIIDFLANHPDLKSLGMNDHIRIVGGAVRDAVLNKKPKDIDIVIDESKLEGKTALDFAKKISEIIPGLNSSDIVMDNYFVIHIGPFPKDFFWKGVNLKGVKLEIVAARKESYEKDQGYKPTSVEKGNIIDDLSRRDFTINTLTAPLSSLEEGLQHKSIEDLLGEGLDHLTPSLRERGNMSPKRTGLIKTPLNPDITFRDDPSRILRAVRFAFKYNFQIDEDTKSAMIKNKDSLKRIPWQPLVDVFVNKILTLPNKKQALDFMAGTGLLKVIGEISQKEQGMQSRLTTLFRELNIDVNTLVFLKNHGLEFGGALSKTDKETDRAMIDFSDLYPDLQHRLQRQKINYKELAEQLNISKSEIDSIREMARKIIINDPRKTDEDVKQEIVKNYSNLS